MIDAALPGIHFEIRGNQYTVRYRGIEYVTTKQSEAIERIRQLRREQDTEAANRRAAANAV